MNKNTQKRFLGEVNKLIKERGRALFSSVNGEKPYFESDELINLLSEHFEIEAVEYYGLKAYSSIEAILFTKYQQINKTERLLTLNNRDLEKEINSLNDRK
jgi:hypothetical protein